MAPAFSRAAGCQPAAAGRRNHIHETGGNERGLPFFFQKPADAFVQDGAEVPYPCLTDNFQHEVELLLAIGRDGAMGQWGDRYSDSGAVFGLRCSQTGCAMSLALLQEQHGS